ncbi:MAG: hypothetical protein H0X25_06840 [Acidobacteriales bacterium]|nr:hypothetical protein [Terriglobales bacterium]
MSHQDIIGFTLAEIAFVLLFSFIAIFVPSYIQLSNRLRSAGSVDVPQLKGELAAAQSKNAQMGAALDQYRRNLRSAAMPSCAEVGVNTWLFTTTITGGNAYQIEGRTYTLSGILQAYSQQLREASERGCRLRVRVFYGPNVSTNGYDLSLRQLEQHFYDSKLGLQP